VVCAPSRDATHAAEPDPAKIFPDAKPASRSKREGRPEAKKAHYAALPRRAPSTGTPRVRTSCTSAPRTRPALGFGVIAGPTSTRVPAHLMRFFTYYPILPPGASRPATTVVSQSPSRLSYHITLARWSGARKPPWLNRRGHSVTRRSGDGLFLVRNRISFLPPPFPPRSIMRRWALPSRGVQDQVAKLIPSPPPSTTD